MGYDIFKGTISNAGSVQGNEGSCSIYSCAFVSTGVLEIVFNEDRSEDEIISGAQALMAEGDTDHILTVAPQFFRQSDGMGGFLFGIRCRFFIHGTTTPISPRVNLFVRVVP